jgi:hypothetical protein
MTREDLLGVAYISALGITAYVLILLCRYLHLIGR